MSEVLGPVARRRAHQAEIEALLTRPRGLAGPAFGAAAGVLGLLALAAGVNLGMLALGSAEPRAKWGYTASAVAFLLQTFQGAPLLALTARLTKSLWAASLNRIAELMALGGLITAPVFVLLLFQLPDWHTRPSIWFDWPGAPQGYDAAAILMLALAGLSLVELTTRPDRRSANPKHWALLDAGAGTLGAIYALLYVYVQVLLMGDLAMSLVPGWHSAIVPASHAIQGLQAGFASVVLAAALTRRLGRVQHAMPLDAFWSASKLLLALTLLLFYLFWAEFLTYWYGRRPDEQTLLTLLMFGPYAVPFALSLLLNFAAPFALLIWNRVRRSVAGPMAAAASIVLGSLFEQIRLFVPAWSLAGPVRKELEAIPPAVFPALPDVLILIGLPAAAALLTICALRAVAPVSIWEYKSELLLKADEPYLRAEVTVLAKPS